MRGVVGSPGGPVSGSRSPGEEPPASGAGPADDKEVSVRGEEVSGGSKAASTDGRRQKKQKVRKINQKNGVKDDGRQIKMMITRNVRRENCIKKN